MTLASIVADFQNDARQLPPGEMVQKYIMPTVCAGAISFDERVLRERIARRFLVPVEGVVIVGSAKLGFTLHDKDMEEEVPRPAYSPFSAASDIDIAIVNEHLFDHIWKLCFDYWDRAGYRYGLPLWDKANDFRNYIFRGWMRPDMLPASKAVNYSRNWFQFFERLMSERAAGDNRITAGLYREAYFFERYQGFSIAKAQARL
jgi:predicted nucleotidyltransferase